MPLPRKFKHLLELEIGDVSIPDYSWLIYAVCGLENDSCGWYGWMLEAAFQIDETKSSPTATKDTLLTPIDRLICPNCGREMFRTGASVRMEPSKDQTPPLIEGVDYVTEPLKYMSE